MIDPVEMLGHFGEVEVVSPLHPSRPREVALVRVNGEAYVLKSKAPPKGTLKQWRLRLSGHADIAHEARVYQALAQHKTVHFRTPRLIATDARYFLLLEYVPSSSGRLDDSVALQQVARAIVEFQTLPLVFNAPLLRHTLLRYTNLYNVTRYLNKLGGALPPGVARDCLRCVIRSHRQQHPLPRVFFVHNDLNPGNLAPDAEGQLVLLDFASVARVRRWIFSDVVDYGFNGKSDWWISPSLITAYLAEIASNEAFSGVEPAPQLRIALLAKLLHMIRFRHWKRRSTERPVAFLTNTLLADDAYAAWFDALIRQGEAELAMVSSAA